MDELMSVYKRGGFNITKIHCDNEFRKFMGQFLEKQYPPIKINYASAQVSHTDTERAVIQIMLNSSKKVDNVIPDRVQ